MAFKVFYLVFVFFLVNSIEGGCDNGWYQLTTVSNKCIQALNPQTWNQSLASCQAAHVQGTLLTINSAFENTEIKQWLFNTNNPYDNFIGLNCIQSPYNWVWADGEPVKYTHFLPGGFPSNQTGNYCVYMTGDAGQWADGECDKDITGGICQYLY